MSEYIQVVTTASGRDEALAIAQCLVEKRLAGCAQVAGPITSVYRWLGAIETSDEWQCMVKTRRDLYRDVEREIARVHSYDTPEILAFPIIEGSARYLDWLQTETSDKS